MFTWAVQQFHACHAQHLMLPAFLLFGLGNIISMACLPCLWLNIALSLTVVFLFFDGFLLALDLKAAEQRVQDLDIFKSSEMIGLIQKITYNQQLLLDIRSRIRPLEKRRGLSLQAQERISETPFMHSIHIRDATPPAHFCFSRNYHDNLENNV